MPRRGENIRKRKDGRWEARFIKRYDSDGRAVYGSVYGKTYFEAKKKQTEALEKLSLNALPVNDHEITVREVLFLWLNNNRIRLKEQTYAKYLYLIENHIIPILGNTKIKKLESIIINNFLLEKSRNGRLDGKGGLSPSYLQTISFIINAALEFSIKEGYRTALLGEIVKPNKRIYKSELEVLSLYEQSVLEEYLFLEPSEQNIGILLSLYMGLRIGEVCGLKWEDIDFTTQTIHIRHTVERIPKINPKPNDSKTTLVLCEAKSVSSNRIIPIPSNIFPLLSNSRNQNRFVIKGNTYEYTDPRSYQNSFHKCLDSCKLRSINYHALRHTFATRCIEAGVDIKTLSEILGHASVNITLNTYVHSSLDHKRKQIELLNTIRGQ